MIRFCEQKPWGIDGDLQCLHLQKNSSYPDTGYYRHFTPLFQRQQCPIQPLWVWPDTGLSLPGYAELARFLVFYQYCRQQGCDINKIGVSGAGQMYSVLHLQMIVNSNGYFHFSLLFSSVASPCDTVTLAFAPNKLLTVFWLMKNNTDDSCENQPNPN